MERNFILTIWTTAGSFPIYRSSLIHTWGHQITFRRKKKKSASFNDSFLGICRLSSFKANKGRRFHSTQWLVFNYITIRVCLINRRVDFFTLANTLLLSSFSCFHHTQFEQTYIPSPLLSASHSKKKK